jgi:hypothetical protein
LAPQPSLGLGLLHKIWLNFVEASQQFSFLEGRVVSPMSNLIGLKIKKETYIENPFYEQVVCSCGPSFDILCFHAATELLKLKVFTVNV